MRSLRRECLRGALPESGPALVLSAALLALRNHCKKENFMSLIPDDLKQQLLENGRTNWKLSEQDKETTDFKPIVKLFDPCGAGTWLLTELAPDDDDLAFGLCDLGSGFPELSSVRIGIERDLHFEADKTLSAYAAEARAQGGINA
jgi:hypothetical protein